MHAYVLMTNHVHLLLTPTKAESTSLLLKHLGQCYVQYVNRSYRRSGTLWEGRFRSCLAREEDYVLACYRYIEMNPVRAEMLRHPRQYRWSSYRANAEGQVVSSPRMNTTESWGARGRRAERRIEPCSRPNWNPEVLQEIRAATNGNYALGSRRFQAEVAAMVGRRVTRRKAGRPPKDPRAPETKDLFG